MREFALNMALVAGVCWNTQVFSQSPLFAPAPTSPITVGPGLNEVILADINRDRHLDMITRHSKDQTVAVLLGDGKGGFKPAAGSPISFDYYLGDVKVGDVNNDKILDLGVTSSDRDTVDILLGDGKGGFRRAPGSPFTASPSADFFTRQLYFLDLNEDGNLDIITATDGRNNLPLPSVLLGNGRGGFAPGSTINLDPGQGLYSCAFGDVDGDGHLDVITASRAPGAGGGPGRVVVQRGDGKGNFKNASGPPVTVLGGPRFGTLGDVNGDRHPDIVLSHGGKPLLTVLLNDGKGNFAAAPGSPFTIGMQAFGVVVADVNKDRKPDLIAATVDNQAPPYDSSVEVLLGDGRRFAAAPGSPFPSGSGAYRLTTGDVNEDGRLDIVTSGVESNAVTILFGR